MEILTSNAIELGKKRNGWFLGYFMDEQMLRTNDLEIQLIEHKKGHVKESTKRDSSVKILSILISGCIELYFPDDNKTVRLNKKGDIAKFDASAKHVTKAIEDSTVITVKWPSVY